MPAAPEVGREQEGIFPWSVQMERSSANTSIQPTETDFKLLASRQGQNPLKPLNLWLFVTSATGN